MNKYFKETKSNRIYTFFARLFGLKYEIESKKYLRMLSQYFTWKEWKYVNTITQVKTFKKKNKTIVQIETHNPGVLIGKRGVFIDGLNEFLKEELNENIEIDLQECKLWHKLYY